KTAGMQKPGLRPLESRENGFNTIISGRSNHNLSTETIAEAASLLKLLPEELERIVSSEKSLPVARAASEDEAALIVRRLRDLGLETVTISDQQLGLDEGTIRIRSAAIDDDSLTGYHLAGAEGTKLFWSDIVLMVSGRLLVKRVEVKERKSRRT